MGNPKHSIAFGLLCMLVFFVCQLSAQISLQKIRVTPEQELWLQEAGVNLKKYEGSIVTQSLLDNILLRFVQYNENHGYPFAKAQLDSVSIDNNLLEASIKLDKGNFISIDTLLVQGNAKVRPKFIYNHLNFKPKQPYSERYVKRIDSRLTGLEFLTLQQPSAVEFLSHSSRIYTFLSNRKANSIYGMLTFGSNENSEFKLHGEANLLLKNLFGGGEELGISWQNPRANTQLLDVSAAAPYLVLGVVGVGAAFSIDKRDSLYLNVGSRLELNTRASDYSTASLFIALEKNNSLDSITWARSTLYGVAYNLAKFNSLTVRHGIKSGVSLAVGNRTSSATDGTSLAATADIGCLFPLIKKMDMLLQAQGKIKAVFPTNTNNLYLGELYPIGGISTIRGYNERSLYASSYTIATIEPRLYYGASSYLCAFYDLAYAQAKYDISSSSQVLQGFGAGAQLDVAAGIITLNFALGYHKSSSLQLQNTKVHIGYRAVF
jgi:outer membrane protein assembly factor BamA